MICRHSHLKAIRNDACDDKIEYKIEYIAISERENKEMARNGEGYERTTINENMILRKKFTHAPVSQLPFSSLLE